jgi:branched-chain amino acid transport system ATP-binding protein
MTSTPLLSVQALNVSYKQLHVIFDLSFRINAGEIVVVVGRNGAGKTTLFRTISGFLKQTSGTIEFNGESISGLPPYRIALKGLKYVPQDKHVFSDLTVQENLELSSYATRDYDWQGVFEYFPKLQTLSGRKAGRLSGGERQMLLMAQALLGKPELVFMDEPTEGLAPHVITEFKTAFRSISRRTTLVIIEQNLPLTAEIADRVLAMKEGKIAASIEDKAEIQNLAFEKYL